MIKDLKKVLSLREISVYIHLLTFIDSYELIDYVITSKGSSEQVNSALRDDY